MHLAWAKSEGGEKAPNPPGSGEVNANRRDADMLKRILSWENLDNDFVKLRLQNGPVVWIRKRVSTVFWKYRDKLVGSVLDRSFCPNSVRQSEIPKCVRIKASCVKKLAELLSMFQHMKPYAFGWHLLYTFLIFGLIICVYIWVEEISLCPISSCKEPISAPFSSK